MASPSKTEDAKAAGAPPLPNIDLSKPRYDQSTYVGRLRHFMETTNPLNVFASNRRLDNAATLVKQYNRGECPRGTTVEQLWKAKQLYDSAYHPETGERMFLPGRMSFQVPGNMFITGMMMTFRSHPYSVVFWQWANQAFNAGVNYTNRSGHNVSIRYMIIPVLLSSVHCIRDVAVPFVAATVAAVGTGLYLNKVLAKYTSPVAFIGRLVPLAAVSAANAINIPLMRYRELMKGNRIVDENGNELGYSKRAARKAIVQTIFSRIAIATPVILFPALVMEQLEKRKTMPASLQASLTIGLVGLSLVFAVPVCLAIFPQKSSMSTYRLEPGVRESILSAHPDTKTIYFNKGL